MNEGTTAAESLTGQTLGEWTVLERVELPDEHSGARFSVGYQAENDRGVRAYVKALDFSRILEDSDDPASAMEAATVSFNAERELLRRCGEYHLSRIVRALDYGTVRIPDTTPSVVSYIIFERADGDASDPRGQFDAVDVLPFLNLAHHASVALQQLHKVGAAHQDLKPSNVLTWKFAHELEGKLGDLGLAYVPGRPAPHDDHVIPGDFYHAPPEQLYGDHGRLPDAQRRFAADMFMLGDLLSFLLTGVNYNSVMAMSLDPPHRWYKWGGTFPQVLPSLVDAHGRTMARLQEAVHRDFADLAVGPIGELCYPDPCQRGDPIQRGRGHNPFALPRYVSRLNLLAVHARIALT